MCFTHLKQKNTADFPHIFYLYIADLLFTESDSLLLLPNTMFQNIQYIYIFYVYVYIFFFYITPVKLYVCSFKYMVFDFSVFLVL
jgi:hypothetical protein